VLHEDDDEDVEDPEAEEEFDIQVAEEVSFLFVYEDLSELVLEDDVVGEVLVVGEDEPEEECEERQRERQIPHRQDQVPHGEEITRRVALCHEIDQCEKVQREEGLLEKDYEVVESELVRQLHDVKPRPPWHRGVLAEEVVHHQHHQHARQHDHRHTHQINDIGDDLDGLVGEVVEVLGVARGGGIALEEFLEDPIEGQEIKGRDLQSPKDALEDSRQRHIDARHELDHLHRRDHWPHVLHGATRQLARSKANGDRSGAPSSDQGTRPPSHCLPIAVDDGEVGGVDLFELGGELAHHSVVL